MKYLEIKITKATLFLTEGELLRALPQELYIEALRRGKGIKRSRLARKRAEQRAEKNLKECSIHEG